MITNITQLNYKANTKANYFNIFLFRMCLFITFVVYKNQTLMDKDQITLHIRIDREVHKQVEAKAKALGLKVSAYVRMLLSKDVQL